MPLNQTNSGIGFQPKTSRTKASGLPEDVITYIEENRLNEVVKSAFNKLLRERPADPWSSLAGNLFQQANKSFPIFDKFEAAPAMFGSDLGMETLSIKVYLQYQGRTEMQHEHLHCYDGDGELEWDNVEEKTGLVGICRFINEELNRAMKGMLLSQAFHADSQLCQCLEMNGAEQEAP